MTALPAPTPQELIAAEIRTLRKGRALQSDDLDRRLGPYLRELADGADRGDMASPRHALEAAIARCAAHLSADLRTAILASLGLSAQTRNMRLFRDRASWLAAHLGYEYRTALRRIGAAEQLLAEEISGELRRRRGNVATAPDGWYLGEFRAVLRLDVPAPQSLENRRIVATRAGLTEVMAWMDVPGEDGRPPAVSAEIVYGGRLVRREQPSGSRFQFVVQLPRPLQAGEEHDYGLLVRMPHDRPMRPHYIFTPECRCDMFDLRVRFDLGSRPRWIRRVQAETVRMFEAAQPDGRSLGLDDAGEVHVRFPRPIMYLGYGVQWQPAA